MFIEQPTDVMQLEEGCKSFYALWLKWMVAQLSMFEQTLSILNHHADYSVRKYGSSILFSIHMSQFTKNAQLDWSYLGQAFTETLKATGTSLGQILSKLSLQQVKSPLIDSPDFLSVSSITQVLVENAQLLINLKYPSSSFGEIHVGINPRVVMEWCFKRTELYRQKTNNSESNSSSFELDFFTADEAHFPTIESLKKQIKHKSKQIRAINQEKAVLYDQLEDAYKIIQTWQTHQEAIVTDRSRVNFSKFRLENVEEVMQLQEEAETSIQPSELEVVTTNQLRTAHEHKVSNNHEEIRFQIKPKHDQAFYDSLMDYMVQLETSLFEARQDLELLIDFVNNQLKKIPEVVHLVQVHLRDRLLTYNIRFQEREDHLKSTLL